MENRISGKTGLLGLMGTPVGHSGSPAMMNFSFQHMGLDYAYLAFDIDVDQVAQAIDAMRLFKMRGFNVTMPCKNEVVKHMDKLSPAARIVGAVNTIVNDDGVLTGHITDGVGFVRNLAEHGVSVKDQRIVVFGAGGAATAIQVQCALDGCKSVSIINKQDEFFNRAKETAKKIEEEAPACQVNVYPAEDPDIIAQEIGNADIVINGTLVGMKPNDGISLVDKSLLRPELVVADVVYNPEKTKLILDAEEAGCKKAIGGSGMLLWQGAESFKLFTGKEMPVKEYQAFMKEQG